MPPKHDLLSVVIPAHNESSDLAYTAACVHWTLKAANIDHEIILVDDHSDDDGVRLAVALLDSHCLQWIRNETSKGYGAAVRAGLQVASGDAVAIVMADGSDDPTDLVRFYRKLQEGYDCVFGSRFMRGGSHVDYPPLKLFLNRLANLFIQVLFFIRYNDVTNAFKLYRHSALDGIQPLLSQQFNLTVEMPLKCIVKGYKYAVLPNSWVNRKHGTSKFKINEMGSRYMAVIFRCFIESDSALAYMCGLVLGVGLVVLWMRWDRPLTGMHSFRQTQTAISAYWLMRGGPWIAYWTPVMGPPWSIPFEFPFYQWMAAGLGRFIPLDSAGRLLSYMFLFLTIIPARALAHDRREWLIFAILLLAAPLYMFWGTAFLMETLALFLSVWFLACARNWGITLIGTAAALCKITTFFPFWCLSVLIRPRKWRAHILPPLIFYGWNWYTDILKAQNPIAKYMVSTLPRMHAHNFGTWGQLFSWNMVETLSRGFQDTFGGTWLITIGLLGLWIILDLTKSLDYRSYKTIGLCLLGYILPLVFFTNLHMAHNYYDVANAIFLLATVSVLLGRLFAVGHPYLAWYCLLMIVASQLLWFTTHFLPDIRDPSELPTVALAHTIERNTTPDGVIAIYGLEWNPLVPYYAHRKAIMEQSCVRPQETIARLEHPSPDVQAILRCPSALDAYPAYVHTFDSMKWEQQPWGECTVYFNRRPLASMSH